MNTHQVKRKSPCLLVGCLGIFFISLIGAGVLVAWFLFGHVIENFRHRQAFDAELWRTRETQEYDTMWPPRLCMVDRLMSSGRLNGLTKEEILALLGEPEEKGFPGGATDCDIHYYLGPERGFFRIDSEWLFITFNEDGKVDRYWLYTD